MQIYWLEQRVNDVPFGDEWLSAYEQSRLVALQFPKRRSDWRLGRWTAKSAAAAYLGMPHEVDTLAEFELRPGISGSPELLLPDGPAPVALSLSHSQGIGLCIVTRAGTAVGCDLESVESRDPAFLTDYFTDSEQELAAQTPAPKRDLLVTLLWSAKESALKAMHCGLRENTRRLHAAPQSLGSNGGDWQRLAVEHTSGGSFSGWWRESGNLVRTILVDAAEKVTSLHALAGTTQMQL